MLEFHSKDLSPTDSLKLFLGGVGPRPIALVSTITKEGISNLSPFSFFNAFGSNPPIVAFCPARRGRDASLKDTYYNLMETKECVIQAVTFDMVEQVNLSSTEYERGVDEFVKSGLTPLDSVAVKPKRVKESPFQMECRLYDMIHLGEKKGSGNLALCEVLVFHVAEDVFKDGIIHPDLLDLVGRCGGEFYARASGSALFEVPKPLMTKGIGYDQLPEFMKRSHVFSANNLGRFGNIEKIPSKEAVLEFVKSFPPLESTPEMFHRFKRQLDYRNMFAAALSLQKKKHPKSQLFMELSAKTAIEKSDSDFAWKAALYSQLDW